MNEPSINRNEENNMEPINGSNILFLGIDYESSKGGIASVEYTYNKIIYPFNFIRTVVNGNTITKVLIFFEALFYFLFYMCFKKNIKIIHIHGASYASFWRKSIFIIIAQLFKKKIIYHMHGGGFSKFSKEHPRAVNYILSKVDVVIALSESWQFFFQNELKCKNVRVIHNIIEEPLYLKINSKDKNVCTFLFLGLICKNKGVYDLLHIIKDNKDAYKNKIKFIIGGNGEVNNLLDFIKKNNLNDIVEYAGWVTGDKKVELFNSADVYILPSYYEGLPISILEAMSYRLPIISTNVGGIPEIVKNNINGIIIKPGDVKALSKSIFEISNSKEKRIKMGNESYKICTPYLIFNVKKELKNLYNNLMPNNL